MIILALDFNRDIFKNIFLIFLNKMAERVGFEPTDAKRVAGFQDRFLQPLGHLSKKRSK